MLNSKNIVTLAKPWRIITSWNLKKRIYNILGNSTCNTIWCNEAWSLHVVMRFPYASFLVTENNYLQIKPIVALFQQLFPRD